MITKKLIHDITTFHNTFIGAKGIVINTTISNIPSFFIKVDIKLLSFNEFGITYIIRGIIYKIHNYTDFEIYKEIVRNKIIPLLNK